MDATEPGPKLNRFQKGALLELARDAILVRLSRGSGSMTRRLETSTDPALTRDRGAFVSVHVDGKLRGCIGSIHAMNPLRKTVADMAVAAATGDSRFAPMTSAELRYADIEISVLSELEPALPEDVVVGSHGLLIARRSKRGVLLPQVPGQYGWDRERFLGEACRKAGLSADAWRTDPDVRIMVFTAQVFSESELEDDIYPPS